MITITTRPATATEITLQQQRQPGLYQRTEKFVMLLIAVLMMLLAPLLIYNKFHPIDPGTQAVSGVAIIILAIILVTWLDRKYKTSSRQQRSMLTQEVEVVRVQTSKAIKREDSEDFGIAYYLDVTHNGQPKTLYLWGQYLDELEEGTFPNTAFEFTRYTGSDEFIDFRISGQYFKEAGTLPPFGKAIWKSGTYPLNGQLLEQSIDAIT